MSYLSNIIVYIWIFPIATQILLPLGMLTVWLTCKGCRNVFSRNNAVQN